MSDVDSETGEMTDVPAARPEQLGLDAAGMDGRRGLQWEIILSEGHQTRGHMRLVVERAQGGFDPIYEIGMVAPSRLRPDEAKLLRGMLDRALKAIKANAE